NRRFGCRKRVEPDPCERAAVIWRTKCEREHDQHRSQVRGESKELHARHARDKDERKDDAQTEVRKKEEQDHGYWAGWAGRVTSLPSGLSTYLPFLPSAQPLVHFRPVDDVPPCGNVVGPAVLILQVVRVLPHIDPEHGFLALHHPVVLVPSALDGQLPAIVDDPRPAAPKAADTRFPELLLEGIEAA